MDVDDVRLGIYRHFLETGRAPSAEGVAADLNADPAEVGQAFVELAESRVITFAPGGRSIRMAHPFSAVPTAYRVLSGDIGYWANCAWDALGIAAMLGRNTRCIARCPDCAEPVDLSVAGGAVSRDGLVHFAVPPRQFWENIAYT